jgi:hypothetical protein
VFWVTIENGTEVPQWVINCGVRPSNTSNLIIGFSNGKLGNVCFHKYILTVQSAQSKLEHTGA